MKKCCITFLLSGIIILSAFIFDGGARQANGEFLRIHIRANSDLQEEQAVKYLVRDGVVECLTPIVARAKDKSQAMSLVQAALGQIKLVAEKTLAENGFFYGATVALKREEFPTRVYGDVTLPGGVYDAVIITLGRGAGQNWWCVVYPPLCFAGTADVVYRSLIWEQIQKWKDGR